MTSVFQGLSSFAPGSGKMRDPGNEVELVPDVYTVHQHGVSILGSELWENAQT